MSLTDQQYYNTSSNYGGAQFVSMKDVVNNFYMFYVGDDKVINNVKRYDVVFHVKRAIQELNYDAFKIIKSLQLTIYDDLKFVLPPDFVNWVKLSLFKNNVIRDLVENVQVQSAT